MTSYELKKLEGAAQRAETIEQLREIVVALIGHCHYRELEIEAVRDVTGKPSSSEFRRRPPR